MTLDEQIIACARSHGYKGNTTSTVRKTNEYEKNRHPFQKYIHISIMLLGKKIIQIVYMLGMLLMNN